MAINMKTAVSSNIAAYGYDPQTQVLDVQFVNNPDTTYSFDNVPENVYRGLDSAASPGAYFHNNIKGRYRFYKA